MSTWRKRPFDPDATQDVRAQLVEEGFDRLAEILYDPLARTESDIKEMKARLTALEQERSRFMTETGVNKAIDISRNGFLAKHGEKLLYILLTAMVGLIGRCSAGVS